MPRIVIGKSRARHFVPSRFKPISSKSAKPSSCWTFRRRTTSIISLYFSRAQCLCHKEPLVRCTSAGPIPLNRPAGLCWAIFPTQSRRRFSKSPNSRSNRKAMHSFRRSVQPPETFSEPNRFRILPKSAFRLSRKRTWSITHQRLWVWSPFIVEIHF